LAQAPAARAIARGFDVALASRTRHNLDALADRLSAEGITATAFPADVLE
jgi:short-subunit dehydrogenase